MTRKKMITRSILASLSIGTLVATVAVLGSSSSQAASTVADGAAARVSTVPIAVAVPDGQELSADFFGDGVQVYQCTAGAWVFVEPAATLTGRTTQGRRTYQTAVHFRGPSWESTQDGSLVTAKAIGTSPVTGSIAQLLLQSTSNRGDGIFGKVSYIQRLNTRGGAAPAGTCTDGATVGVHYTANYRFFTPAS